MCKHYSCIEFPLNLRLMHFIYIVKAWCCAYNWACVTWCVPKYNKLIESLWFIFSVPRYIFFNIRTSTHEILMLPVKIMFVYKMVLELPWAILFVNDHRCIPIRNTWRSRIMVDSLVLNRINKQHNDYHIDAIASHFLHHWPQAYPNRILYMVM